MQQIQPKLGRPTKHELNFTKYSQFEATVSHISQVIFSPLCCDALQLVLQANFCAVHSGHSELPVGREGRPRSASDSLTRPVSFCLLRILSLSTSSRPTCLNTLHGHCFIDYIYYMLKCTQKLFPMF